ncbi:hypothetical protein CHARACLAT_015463, partial [Characodon lateralis]|nr:hypothetical protein [Characodon lateralis]
VKHASNRLSVIDESSFLSHSDISYDRTDDDVDLDTTVIKPLRSRARERRRSSMGPVVGGSVGKRNRSANVSAEFQERKMVEKALGCSLSWISLRPSSNVGPISSPPHYLPVIGVTGVPVVLGVLGWVLWCVPAHSRWLLAGAWTPGLGWAYAWGVICPGDSGLWVHGWICSGVGCCHRAMWIVSELFGYDGASMLLLCFSPLGARGFCERPAFKTSTATFNVCLLAAKYPS